LSAGIAGTLAAVKYLAGIGQQYGEAYRSRFPGFSGRRLDLKTGMTVLREYDHVLSAAILDELETLPGVQIHGITDRNRLEERVLWRQTAPMMIRGRANPTADGKYVCVMLMEDQPEEKPAISFSYSRFREFFHLKPLTQIARIEVATGAMEVIHEDRRYMGHVNTSPALPDILTYCHEGPWNWIDQRIWGLNIQTGETWKVRPQEGDYSIGHEYWFADGVHIGYHGRPPDESGRHVFGHIRWDNEEWVEDHFPFHGQSWKMLSFACALSLPGQDADRGQWDAGVCVHQREPRAALHPVVHPTHFVGVGWGAVRGTQDSGLPPQYVQQSARALSRTKRATRFTPDGKAVLYTSDLTAYSNMYLVEVGEFDELPDLE
jgi:oligogalacturonide lyase